MADVISKRIADGTYPPGSRVLGIVELSAGFGIAASTARKALAHLRGSGEMRTELGLGTFVVDTWKAGSAGGLFVKCCRSLPLI